MQPHAGRPHSSPPSSSSRFSPTTTDPSRDVGELLDAADDRRFQDSRSALTPLFDAYEAMTSRIGVPRFTRMTVISPVFLLCARTVIMPSSPVRRSTGESAFRAAVAPMALRSRFERRRDILIYALGLAARRRRRRGWPF